MGKKLVIAEKPSAAMDMANILNCHQRKDGYIEGNDWIITWCVGHLVGLKEPGEYKDEWGKWNLEDLPLIPNKFELKVLSGTNKQFNIVKQLIHRDDIDMLINAGDAGREGLLIQNWTYKMAQNEKPIKVLWVSSLTEEALKKGFKDLKNNKDFELLQEAAESRAIFDWTHGINYSRAYTKKKSNGIILSVGRCQTPILAMICNRDIERENFKSMPYFQLKVILDFKGDKFNAYYTKDRKNIFNFEKEEPVKNLINGLNKNGIVKEVFNKENKIKAPKLYDITTLQKVMSTKFGYTPNETLKIAQVLYEKHKILSYPRTGSRYLSEDVFNEINKHLECLKFGKFEELIKNIKEIKKDTSYVNNNKITDHHALIPTINNIKDKYNDLSDKEKNIFDEIVVSLIAIFYDEYIYNSTTILTDINNNIFISKGKSELQLGWKAVKDDLIDVENENFKEIDNLTNISEGIELSLEENKILKKNTTPKLSFTDSTVLASMEKYNIGTQATRHTIIETLIKRNFIERKNKTLISTKLGRDFISVIETDELKSLELTSEIENKLSKIENGEITRQQFFKETINALKFNIDNLKNSNNTDILKKEEKPKVPCPICKEGYIISNTKAYGCSRYKEGCKFVIWKEIAKKKLTENQINQLILKGKTGTIKGFKKKNGDSFDAALILKNGKVEFSFF